MDINEATAKAIAAERAISGLTIRELAERSGVNERTLMRILQAEREIKITQIAQLAAAFEIYPHEIIERAEVILARREREQPPPRPTATVRPLRPGASDVGAAEDTEDPSVIAAMEDLPGEDMRAEMERYRKRP